MPNGFKAVLAIVIVAVIGAGGYYYYTTKTLTPEEQAQETANDTGMTSPTNTSDEALSKDSMAIDAQLTGLDTDTATVQTGVQDAVTVQ